MSDPDDEINFNDNDPDVEDTGIPGLFNPQQCDVDEELQDFDSFQGYQRDRTRLDC